AARAAERRCAIAAIEKPAASVADATAIRAADLHASERRAAVDGHAANVLHAFAPGVASTSIENAAAAIAYLAAIRGSVGAASNRRAIAGHDVARWRLRSVARDDDRCVGGVVPGWWTGV